MNDMTTAMPDPLVFTESAANKVKALIEEEGNEELPARGATKAAAKVAAPGGGV